VNQSLSLIPELQTIVVERITHPGGAQPVREEALVILEPELFVLECVDLAEFATQIPSEGIELAAFFYVLDNDGQVGFLS
jgi:hypothetical protein